MKQPGNNYRYSITNILGTSAGVPAFGEGDFRLEWNLRDGDGGPFDYSKDFPSKVVFKEAVFSHLLSIEITTTRCEFMTLVVERFCDGAWSPLWFVGRFSLNDATWNLHKCEVEVKLDRYDENSCIEDNKTQEVDLLAAIPVRVSVKPYNANVIIEKVDYQINPTGSVSPDPYWGGAGTPEAGRWVVFYHYYGVSINVIPYYWKTTKWARQTLSLPVADPSPGAEWTLDSTAGGFNKWVKPASVYDCKTEEIQNEGMVVYASKKECKILGESGGLSSIDNGMKLKDCLEAFAARFCPDLTVKSEFFQINPDTVTATNYVTGLASKVRNIIVFQKSDVKRPAVSGNATKAPTTWDRFMGGLGVMFNLRWRVDGSTLRIEHISWFSKNAGYDLTLPRFAKFVNGLVKYSYKTEQIPNREEFKFMEAGGADFIGRPIEYGGGCVSEAGRKAPSTFAADTITTDVELVLNNPGADSNVVEDKGLVFIACDQTGAILSEAPILDTGTRLNNVLSWAHLHRDYHKHHRALKSGFMNGQPTTFLSVRPLKKGVSLTVPLCCDDVFNPDDTVETALGVGTVEKASFSLKSNMLTLDLVYPSDGALYIPPVANNDVLEVVTGGTSPLDVLTNDTPSPSGPITVIEIVAAPVHGSAVVVAGPGINYTPTPGYFGQDNLVYRLKDAVGIPSNNALVAIDIKSGVYVRLTVIDQSLEYLAKNCGSGDEPAGQTEKATFRLSFFSDAAGTVPVNTTGMGLIINVTVSGVYGDPGNAPTSVTSAHAATGTTMDVFSNYYFYREFIDCSNILEYYSETISVAPGQYEIL